MASFAKPKISSQFLRVNGILKFVKQSNQIYKFALSKGEASRLELCFADLQLQGRHEAVPLSPPPFFLNPLNPSHVQSACDSTIVPHVFFMPDKLTQILKFMSEHITALNLVLNIVKPRFSSLLRRVSKILKFVNLLC